MAQQARPNVAGHIEFFLAHATALPTVVSRTPRWTSSSTSSGVIPVLTPGISSAGTGSGHLPGVDGCRPVAGSPGCGDPFPLQAALVPHVEIGDEHQADEHDHLDQAEQPELPEGDGPGVEEDGLD